VLKYCELLGVRLEIYVMETTANLFQTTLAFDGQPQPRRRIVDDTQGYVAELLAKAVRKRSLDEELTEVDRDKLLSLLQTYGDLQSNYVYAGSTRSGCEYDLTVAQAC
jgi:monoamine oxidase